MQVIIFAVVSWVSAFPSADMGMKWSSWLANPAFIGMKSIHEFGISGDFYAQDTVLTIGYRVDGFAVAYRIEGQNRDLLLGVGSPLASDGLLRKLSVGYTYSRTKQMAGLAFWPSRYFTAGMAVEWDRNSINERFGVGVRPFTEMVTLWGNANMQGNYIRSVGIGISFSPARWLDIRGAANCPVGTMQPASISRSTCEYQIGTTISLGHSRLNVESAGESMSFGLAFSKEYQGSPFKHRKIVRVVLDGKYPEQTSSSLFKKAGKSFYSLIHSLKALRDRDDVVGVLIVLKNPSLSTAQVEELVRELAALRKNGKKVLVFSKNFYTMGLWLASQADVVAITSSGYVVMPGFVSGSVYFKRMLDRIGVDVDAFHIKEYKSAIEPFTRRDMSEYDRQQRMDYMTDMKSTIWPAIAGRMGKSTAYLDSLVDSQGMWNDSEAVKLGFVDTIIHSSQLKEWAQDELDCKQLVDIDKIVEVKDVDDSWKIPAERIAVLYIEGGIVSGKSGNDMLTGKTVGDETIVKAIKEIKKDKSIKAVVVRVNSPGGSALASEEIWFALRELKDKKPVIVSMGDMAASGGYYVSVPSDVIMADSTTLTGSIGILSLKFVFRRTLEKLGIDVDYTKIGRHADAMSSILRPLTPDEETLAMKELRYGYNIFINRVAVSRGMTPEKVDSIGRGHIYSGIRALGIGLVDSIGGLEDAIELARRMANAPDAEVVFFPKPRVMRLLEELGVAGRANLDATKSLLRENYLYLMPPFWVR